MKKLVVSIVILFLISTIQGFAQDTALKASKSDKKEIVQSKIEILINSKTFEFIGIRAFPTGFSPVELSSNPNGIVFTPELIISDMPYYGTGYSGMAYGRDKGMHFKGIPENYTFEKTEKGYEISADVMTDNDTNAISLSVSESGYATLTLSGNGRSTISYQGEIVPYKEK